MNKLGLVSFSSHCVVILFLCSVSPSLYSNEGDISSSNSSEETHNSSRDSDKGQQESPKDSYRHPEPVKNLIESYVDRRHKEKYTRHSKKPYHPGKENPFQPRPRIPENCTEEVRRNYQNCQDQQKKRTRLSLSDHRKCQQYRKWFQTRCQAAHNSK